MNKINILMLVPEFAPSSEVGAKRPLRLFNEMLNVKWEPYIVTVKHRCCDRVDMRILEQIKDPARIYRIGCKSIWNHSSIQYPYKSINYFLINRMLRAVAKITNALISTDKWFPWSYIAYKKSLKLIHDNNIDVIWATIPRWSGAHLAYRLHNKTNVPYILDFRDVRHAPENAHKDRFLKRILALEKTVISKAAGLTYVAPAQIEVLYTLYPDSKNCPSELIYNWFDRRRYETILEKPFDKPTIVYGGSLYGGTRDIRAFFKALSLAQKTEDSNLNKLQFILFGIPAEFTSLKKSIQDYNIEKIVDLRPAISEDEFISYCKSADILLLSVGRNQGHKIHSETIPAKLFTYFACNRPILAIGPGDFTAGQLVQQANRGISCDDQNVDDIFRAIGLLLRKKGNNGNLNLNMNAVEQYESNNVAKQYLNFIEKIIS